MRIKALQITGFKSFADTATFRFGDGITGVVGPNGCGKSNIIDATRWVLGEMSAKHLRGKAMQDVIFAGSESRGPSGMAEVTLTFHNDGNVPPQYASYSEIAVTRRLHRDGTSEYLINKSLSRLRDITDLFLGTGVGTRAYSIIEQGRIGFIVSARPEDRRTLIEEVAGITKFKARRKTAERRMQATEQNLARVTDIIAELERQLGSLRRQAKKAERYKQIKAELRDVDLHVATMKLLELAAREKVQLHERSILDDRQADTHREVEIEEARQEAERVRHIEEEKHLQSEQSASAEIDARLAALERDLDHWRHQAQEAAQRASEATADTHEARNRLDNLGSERTRLSEEVAAMRASAQEEGDRLEAAEIHLEEAQRRVTDTDRQIEALRRDALEWVHQLAQQRSVLATLERQHQELGLRQERSQREQAQAAAGLQAVEEQIATLEARADQTDAELQGWRARREQLAATLQQLSAEVTRGEQAVLAVKTELAEVRSRLNSLETIARRLEGFSEGVRALMQPAGEASEPAVPGLQGLVSELFATEPRYEIAIEALAGDNLQLLVVEEHAAAVAAIRYLQAGEAGRSGFVLRTPRQARGEVTLPSGPDILAPARALVTAAPECEGIADALLGGAVVVENLDIALRCWAQGWPGVTFVTLQGELLDAAGTLSGGFVAGEGLLAKAREIRELQERVAELQGALAVAEESQRRREAERLQIEVDIQQLDKEIRQGELDLLETRKDLQAAGNERQRLSERVELCAHELQQLGEELTSITHDKGEASAAVAVAEGKRDDLEAQISGLQEIRAEQAFELEEHATALTTLKVQAASRREKLVGSQAAIERLDHSEEEYNQRILRGDRTATEGQTLANELQQKIEEGSALAHQTAAEAQARRQKLSEARAAYETERIRLAEVEQTLKERRRANELVRESLVELKMDLQRLQLDREQLLERVAERHDVDLLRVAGDYHMRSAPGAEELERRNQMERSLKSMGSINLTAIEECAEVEKRFAFLDGQRTDLNDALDSLRRAINRINRTSRQRFREAFDSVNTMFQQVFPRLFRGGEARLELLNHDDVLEAGVDIFAQPPGKKLQSVGLLSGGEKALTATALIFAIFLIKPTPFCVLDEVDAPLDDANVRRFNEMLREISKISQFIVITHNKLTMTEADRLYGVTMEEPGMSKIVAVDLDEESKPGEQAA